MTIENVDPESGDLTLRDFYGATHKNVNNNWVQTMDIFRNSSLKVRKKGYGWIRNEQFEEQVLGESLAHLDTAFAPVLYRYADKAILSRRVYDNEDNALYLPVLRVDAQGIVKGITTYSDPVEEFSNSRAYLLKLPGASYLLDHCEFIMDAGVYEQDNSGSDIRRRMRWHRNPEIKARSGARKFFGVIGESILALIFLIPFGVLWGWYYCVTFCLIPCILIQVARSPKPFERLSNEQLDKFFKWLSYPHLYLVLLLGAVNLDVNLFWGLVGMIGACSCIFGFARLLVSKRCPDCKHTFCHELADTEWGEPYYTKEEVTESHREGSKQTGSTKECTEVSGLGPAGANVAEVDVTVTEHYDVTIRHDVYEVTYEHQDGIEYHKCRYCGHVKTEKTNRFKLYSREYVRSYYTHQKEDKTHREEDRMR